MKSVLLAFLFVLMSTSAASSHALEPGYLELESLGNDTWRVFWRKPDVNGGPMPIDARLSAPCDTVTGPPPRFDGAGWSAQWVTRCAGGLSGVQITIDGLAQTSTDVLVRYEITPGHGQSRRLVPSTPGFTVPSDPTTYEVFSSYTTLGIEHILFGVDHLLFVLALLILIRRRVALIAAITAFTVAHSITLGAAALGFLMVPGPPVEAVIALSIAFVASEILNRDPDTPRLSERAPGLLAFAFGLIHGLGFGSALSDIGLPQNEIVLALLAFNVGVELGQLAFIFVVITSWALAKRAFELKNIAVLNKAAAYAIGSLAAFWFVERIATF